MCAWAEEDNQQTAERGLDRALDSEPCREGALHGLGHWHLSYPERTATIIDQWLAGQPRISPELRPYATSGRAGCVL